MKKVKLALVTATNSVLFPGLLKGTMVVVRKSFWRNGEGWAVVEVGPTLYTLPDIFLEEVK